MSNAGTVASPGKGFGGASQREKNGGSQDDRVVGKSVTKEEQAEIDKMKQEIEEYKGKVESYEAKLKEYKAELKEYKAAGRIEEAGHCQEIILELYAGIRQKEVLIQELYAGIQRKEALILEKHTRKRNRAVDAADDTLGSKFMRQLRESQMDDRLVHFATNLFGQRGRPHTVIVRECYKEFYKAIVEFVDDKTGKNEQRVVHVSGTPGTGKTVCGLYVMLRLLKGEERETRETIVYIDRYSFQTPRGAVYLLGPKESTIIRDAREKGHEIEESDDEYWRGRIMIQSSEGQNLLEWLLCQSDLWCVLDAPAEGITFQNNTNCVTLVFSSPRRGMTSSLKHDVGLKLWMPLWEMEELKSASRQLDHHIDESDLEERFAFFGGVARRVLAENYAYQKLSFYDTLRQLTLPKAKDVMDPFSSNTDASSLFVHIVPTEQYQHYNTRIATDMVERRISLQVALSENWNMGQWAEVASHCGLKNAAGNVFECVWHNAMALGRETPMKCKLRNLESKETTTTTVETPSLPHPAKTFANNKMTDLEILKEGQYCLPLTPNFETVDSWLVMRKPFVDERNENLCLVQFQVTTAQSHPLRQAGEMRVIQKAQSLFGVKNWEACNIYIVFVVLHANFSGFKKQKWTTAEDEEIKQQQGNLLKHIRQLALAIPQELEPNAPRMSLETD